MSLSVLPFKHCLPEKWGQEGRKAKKGGELSFVFPPDVSKIILQMPLYMILNVLLSIINSAVLSGVFDLLPCIQ